MLNKNMQNNVIGCYNYFFLLRLNKYPYLLVLAFIFNLEKFKEKIVLTCTADNKILNENSALFTFDFLDLCK